MRITQRQIAIAMQIINMIGLGILSIALWTSDNTAPDRISVSTSFFIALFLLMLYIRGWRYAIPVILSTVIIVISITTPLPIFAIKTSIQLLLPAAIAMLLGNTRWVVFAVVIPFVVSVIRVLADNQPLPNIPSYYSVFVVIATALILARFSIDTALKDAQANAQQLDQARQEAEEQSRHLALLNQGMESQIKQQQGLLDLVTSLEAPISPLADGVLFMPIVGALDTRRIHLLTERILQAASQQRTQLVVLDIAGVSGVDQQVAQGLISISQALRLLGCRAIISGISAEVAIVLANMQEISNAALETVQSPQEALERYQ